MKGEMEELNEHELAELKKRADLTKWVDNKEELIEGLILSTLRRKLIQALLKPEQQQKAPQLKYTDPELRHLQDYETYFMEMLVST